MGEDGTDLGAYMVRSGLALAETDDYRAEQADARRRGAGPWEGQFMPPWEMARGRALTPGTGDRKGSTWGGA